MKKLWGLGVLLLISFEICAAGKIYSGFSVEVSGTGQPLFMIPGATCSGHEWDETITHYKGKFQFHVFTLAGYAGLAPLKNGPYLDSFRLQIEQYIRDNHLSRVILMGHSIGGFLSLLIGIDSLPEIQKIVIIDAMPFFAGAMNPAASAGFSEEKAKMTFMAYNSMNDSAMFRNQLAAAKYLCNDSTHWNQIATWGMKSDKKTMAYSITEMMGNDLRQAVSAIQIPVLVLAAYSASPQFPAYTREFALKTYINQYDACSKCSIDMAEGGTKHFIMYDNPAWMYKELDGFILSE
jgi:N-formylmaleamate deformylase